MMFARRTRTIAALAATAALTVACASGGRPNGDVAAPDGEDLRVGSLSARELASGQCGLFLWRRSADQPLVFFFNSTTGRAAIVVDRRERALRRLEVTSASGGARYGEQVFTDAGGEISARVAIHEREDVPGGARITRAALSVSDDRGWRSVIGVGGLAACQP